MLQSPFILFLTGDRDENSFFTIEIIVFHFDDNDGGLLIMSSAIFNNSDYLINIYNHKNS